MYVIGDACTINQNIYTQDKTRHKKNALEAATGRSSGKSVSSPRTDSPPSFFFFLRLDDEEEVEDLAAGFLLLPLLEARRLEAAAEAGAPPRPIRPRIWSATSVMLV